MSSPKDRWLDREAGPVVRPYAVTRGRTRPHGDGFDLLAVVTATGRAPLDIRRLSPEHLQILRICRLPTPVVDVASDVAVPLGVARVLLGDLREEGLITLVAAPQADTGPEEGVLREVLNGLRAL
ncbi:DUF742 domain-containing protein [Actinomadura sp. HBU206391]|uniref:DUF742 domain-containing protein n=1 Tax=Actinomadura sp. HBU206391 TaxID=2731692 RepID=UPI00164F43AA|nr:DUF742 domain-containing protein [Actinomadura sp. HBU206391]MBC6458320.1 DUF742 domain-containing protein [Actinomadura sp. HBU206391]